MMGGYRSTLTLTLCAATLWQATSLSAQAPEPINYEAARLERAIAIGRAGGPIALDGVLDEPAWASAPVAKGFIQNDPHEDQPATFDTEVRVLYDGEALYLGVFAKDDEPGAIIVNDLKKDFNTDSNDGFRVVLDTSRTAATAISSRSIPLARSGMRR
jgi:hypothetical protein